MLYGVDLRMLLWRKHSRLLHIVSTIQDIWNTNKLQHK